MWTHFLSFLGSIGKATQIDLFYHVLPMGEVININKSVNQHTRLSVPGYSYVLDAEQCREDAGAPDATWAKEELSETCASQECISSNPAWLAEILDFTSQRLGRR